MTKPDLERWSDADFETRSDEVCAYVHSLDLGDDDCSSGAARRLWPVAVRTLPSEGSPDERLRPLVTEARAGSSNWHRVGKMLSTSAADAQEHFAEADQAVQAQVVAPPARPLERSKS